MHSVEDLFLKLQNQLVTLNVHKLIDWKQVFQATTNNTGEYPTTAQDAANTQNFCGVTLHPPQRVKAIDNKAF